MTYPVVFEGLNEAPINEVAVNDCWSVFFAQLVGRDQMASVPVIVSYGALARPPVLVLPTPPAVPVPRTPAPVIVV
jgi:hypothetical protein